MSVFFAVLSALSNALTAVLQREANVSAPPEQARGWRIVPYLVRHPLWLLGVVFMITTLAFSATALYFGSLAQVQPVLVSELVFTLALRRLLLHKHVPANNWTAAALICAGLATFLVVADPRQGTRVPGAGTWMVSVGVVLAAVGVLLLASRGAAPRRRAALLGTCGGALWAVDAAFVKSTTDVLRTDGWSGLLLHWPVYAAVVSGIAGTLMVQAAFHAGPLAFSQPGILITDPLASIALGIVLFADRLTFGPLDIALEVIGLAVMATGVILLSRWEQPAVPAPDPRGAAAAHA